MLENLPENEVHISSLVVHVRPESLEITKEKILALPNTEIYGESEEGKIIVVLETENQGYITDSIDKINDFEDVLNVALVFHQIEHFDSQCEDES
ncbi:chaperone NapD [Aliivibrio fischeri]|uniref:Chaperone NapD n=5 Tax=Aliivibrio fischeri TaxID=668 RepID=Q5E3J5_ALIF1|nr:MULTISPECIES: chaperone NapD [Aliivibrio]AAW86401.1 protein required for assembly of periplasmic nitrate reductase (NapA) [Aliivibrio fischeri ES114]ACH65588.1 NapD protein [Aliivibrio fischeri MJ11]EHN70351.1 NapD protein [Aliivibrio fischeri SR5]KLU79310.1 nitrate reductase [Aliivibrio fischeri]MBD1569092.1 chaperone NapD [Aliivibrio sp. S10_S31]